MVEVETGLPPGAEPGTAPRGEYDPATRSLTERMQAKAAELGVSLRTVEGKRSRYLKQGLWGLVDQRTMRRWEATGRADARLVAAIREVLDSETHVSTGTRSRLIRRVIKTVEATHGEGAVGGRQPLGRAFVALGAVRFGPELTATSPRSAVRSLA